MTSAKSSPLGTTATTLPPSPGYSAGTTAPVRKFLVATGIDTRTNPNPQQRDRDIRRLHRDRRTSRQIAKEVGCSHSTVSVTIRKYQQAQAAEAS